MRLPNPIPSPISGGMRWSMASAANIAHLEHGTKVANEAPVPEPVIEALAATSAHHWGQLGDLASAIAVELPLQILEAAWHYPLGAVAVIWWILETIHLIRKLIEGLKSMRERRRRKRLRQSRSARKSSAPCPRTKRRAKPQGRGRKRTTVAKGRPRPRKRTAAPVPPAKPPVREPDVSPANDVDGDYTSEAGADEVDVN